MRTLALVLALPLFLLSCTQETEKRIARGLQSWSGSNGVLDVMSEGKVMYRFIKIERLTTAVATNDASSYRPYRFGYGVMDTNFNYVQDDNEKKTYFEVSDYSTSYVFYENPED